MKRPALCFFISLACAITAVKLGGKYAAVFVVFVAFAIGIVLAKKKTRAALIIPIAAVAGTLLMGSFLCGEKDIGDLTTVKGIVKDAQMAYGKRQILTVDVSEVFKDESFKKEDMSFTVYTKPGVYVKRNDICIFSGTVKKGNAGMDGLMFANTVYFCGHNKGGLLEPIYILRDKICDSADSLYPKNEAGTIKALVTGISVFINPSTKQLYSAAGISHILAVSGLHTGLIAAMVLFALKLLKVKARTRTVFVMIFLAFYGIFIGGRAPCIRAVVMLEIVFLGQMIYRKNDGINSLAFAGVLILLFQPYALFQAGFQLSFVSVLSLLITSRFFKSSYGIFGRVIEILTASLVVTIFTFPIMAYYFYGFSVYGFITNIFAIPAAGFLVGFAAISCLFGILNHAFGIFFAGTAFYILKYMEYVCNFVSSLPYSTVQTGRLPIAFTVLYYLGLMVPFAVGSIKKQLIFILVDTAAILCVLFSNRIIFKENTYYFMSKNKGQSEIVSSFDGHTYIIGGREYSSATDYAGELSDFLLSMGKTKADAVFVTNTEKSDFVLNLMDHIEIGTIVMPEGQSNESSDVIKNKAMKNGTQIVTAMCGKTANLKCGVEVKCVYPTGKEREKTGHAVYMVKDNDFDFIDITSADGNDIDLIKALCKDKHNIAAINDKYKADNILADSLLDGSSDVKMRGDKTWELPQ